MISDLAAKAGAEPSGQIPLCCFTQMAFPVSSDGVLCTELWGEKHIRFHISLKISSVPKQAAEYK